MPTLPELQTDFMRALFAGSDPSTEREILAGALAPAQRLAIYANNAETNFIESLRLSFPAVLRLVGDAYFTHCAREYRAKHPSRSGDLQHTGAAFPGLWAERHGLDQYRYLGDVARFEWLYQETLTAADHADFDLLRLAAVAPDRYDTLRFRLHPSARLFASEYPVLAIWQANVGSAADPEIIDLNQGGDRLLLIRTPGGVEMQPQSIGEYAFLEQLSSAAPFAAAIEAAGARDAAFDATASLQKLVINCVVVDFAGERAIEPQGGSNVPTR
jgi:hypothetical protein